MPKDLGVTTVEETTENLTIGDDHHYKAGVIETTGAEVTYEVGTLFGKKTVGGKLKQCDPAAVDGTDVVWAILLEETIVGDSADENVVLLIWGPVNDDALDWTNFDAAEKATEIENMKNIGIFVDTLV